MTTIKGCPCCSSVKNLPANVGDTGSVGSTPGSGSSPGGGNGNPLQHSCLENSMGRERSLTGYTVHWVAKSWPQLITCAHTQTYAHTNICNSNQSSLKTETHLLDYSGFPSVCLLFRPSSRSPFIDCLPGPHPKPNSVQKSKLTFSHLKEKKM